MNDPLNYMDMIRTATSKGSFASNLKMTRSPKEHAKHTDRILEEITSLAARKETLPLAVMLEHELVGDLIHRIGNRKDFPQALYVIEKYDPFNLPVISNLSKEDVCSLAAIKKGSHHFENWDKNQSWYAEMRLGGNSPPWTIRDKKITLMTGMEGADYHINKYSYSIQQYFYLGAIVPEKLPLALKLMIDHSIGIQIIRKKPTIRTIKKDLEEMIKLSELPIRINVQEQFDRVMEQKSSWVRSRDVHFVHAATQGKRDMDWLANGWSYEGLLTRLTEGLGQYKIHPKHAIYFSNLVLKLCGAVDSSTAGRSVVLLTQGLAQAKTLNQTGISNVFNKISSLQKSLGIEQSADALALLPLKVIMYSSGEVSARDLADFCNTHNLHKATKDLIANIYPNAIEQSRALTELGYDINTKKLIGLRGIALEEDLGL